MAAIKWEANVGNNNSKESPKIYVQNFPKVLVDPRNYARATVTPARPRKAKRI